MSSFKYNPLTGRFDIVGEGGSGGDIDLVHGTGNRSDAAMSQLGVTRAINSLSTVPVFDSIIDGVIKTVTQTSPYTGNDGVVVYSTYKKRFMYEVGGLYYSFWSTDGDFNANTTMALALPNKMFKCAQDNQNYVYNDKEEVLEKINITNKMSSDDALLILDSILKDVDTFYQPKQRIVTVDDWKNSDNIAFGNSTTITINANERVIIKSSYATVDEIFLNLNSPSSPEFSGVETYELILPTGSAVPSLTCSADIKWVKEPVLEVNKRYAIVIDVSASPDLEDYYLAYGICTEI